MQVEGISNGLIEGISIEDHYTANPGLVRITIGVNPRYDESGDCSNYGFSTWEFIVGGQGPGYDIVVGMGDTRSLLQEECAAPVAVRFSTPIAHVLVDDMGFLDNVVWTSLGSTADIPTLLQIVNMVGELLLGSAPPQGEHASRKLANYEEMWSAAQRHALHKHSVAQKFKAITKHPEFLGVYRSYSALSFEPWLLPEFTAMQRQLSSALIEAAQSDSAYSGGPLDSNNITALLSYNNARKVAQAWKTHVAEQSAGIFTFDLFTRSFCDSFVEELALYESSALPRRRPNTMNNYGLILNDIGMYGLMQALMLEHLAPLVRVLYWQEPVAYGLDHHHSFIVQYQRGIELNTDLVENGKEGTVLAAALAPVGDKGLDMHSDSSEVTVNVCLGKEGFRGGGLRFCGQAGTPDYRKLQCTLQHVIGRAVVHLGRHRHGADDLLPADSSSSSLGAAETLSPANERLNLIMWLRSSTFRAAAAYGHIAPDGFPRIPEPEGFVPDVCCLSRFNDPDYDLQLRRAHEATLNSAS